MQLLIYIFRLSLVEQRRHRHRLSRRHILYSYELHVIEGLGSGVVRHHSITLPHTLVHFFLHYFPFTPWNAPPRPARHTPHIFALPVSFTDPRLVHIILFFHNSMLLFTFDWLPLVVEIFFKLVLRPLFSARARWLTLRFAGATVGVRFVVYLLHSPLLFSVQARPLHHGIWHMHLHLQLSSTFPPCRRYSLSRRYIYSRCMLIEWWSPLAISSTHLYFYGLSHWFWRRVDNWDWDLRLVLVSFYFILFYFILFYFSKLLIPIRDLETTLDALLDILSHCFCFAIVSRFVALCWS